MGQGTAHTKRAESELSQGVTERPQRAFAAMGFRPTTSSTDLLVLSSIGTEVSFRPSCPAGSRWGILPQHVRLMTKLVPGKMIVRKDGRNDLLAVGGWSCVRDRRPCVHRDGYGRLGPRTSMKPKSKKPVSVPRPALATNFPPKKSPPSTPRWLAPWPSCASSAGSENDAHNLF